MSYLSSARLQIKERMIRVLLPESTITNITQYVWKIDLDEFVARCMTCKTKFGIPDMGPCTDLEYKEYIKDSGCECKCGKNDWQLISD